MVVSKVGRVYAPVVTNMLIEFVDASKSGTSSNDIKTARFIGFKAASFVHQCKALGLNLNELRNSVETRISECETLLKMLDSVGSGNYKEQLSSIKRIKDWAKLCGDAVSFGQMMSWLEVQVAIGMRYFIHDSAPLQLFAYICERVRIRGTELPKSLNELFDNMTIYDFLWYNKRPKTSEDCDLGIRKWCDLSSVNRVTKHIFHARNHPTLTQEIFEKRGGVTSDMVKWLQKKGVTLEKQLKSELDVPDLLRFAASVLKAAKSLTGKDWAASDLKYWHYLRYTVLNTVELEKKLFDAFKKEWEPKDPNVS